MRRTLVVLAVVAACMLVPVRAVPLSVGTTPTNGVGTAMQKFGGFVFDYREAKGRIVFASAQKKLPQDAFEKVREYVQNEFAWRTELVSMTEVPTLSNATKLRDQMDASVVVFIVESEVLPVIVTAPEDRLAFVNVRRLEDASEGKKFVTRVRKELLRALAYALNAGTTTFGAGTISSIITSVDALDAVNGEAYAPDVANLMRINSAEIWLKPFRRTTYLRACKEGWADPPKNEWQRAVQEKAKEWLKTHSLDQKIQAK